MRPVSRCPALCQRAQPNDLCVLSTMARSYHPPAPGGPSPVGSAHARLTRSRCRPRRDESRRGRVRTTQARGGRCRRGGARGRAPRAVRQARRAPRAHLPVPRPRGDRTGYVDGVSDEHRCFAFGDPAPLSAEQQTRVCQERGYGNCPRYLRGVLVIPTEELEALRRPRARDHAGASAAGSPSPSAAVGARCSRSSRSCCSSASGAWRAFLLFGLGGNGVAVDGSPSPTPTRRPRRRPTSAPSRRAPTARHRRRHRRVVAIITGREPDARADARGRRRVRLLRGLGRAWNLHALQPRRRRTSWTARAATSLRRLLVRPGRAGPRRRRPDLLGDGRRWPDRVGLPVPGLGRLPIRAVFLNACRPTALGLPRRRRELTVFPEATPAP